MGWIGLICGGVSHRFFPNRGQSTVDLNFKDRFAGSGNRGEGQVCAESLQQGLNYPEFMTGSINSFIKSCNQANIVYSQHTVHHSCRWCSGGVKILILGYITNHTWYPFPRTVWVLCLSNLMTEDTVTFYPIITALNRFFFLLWTAVVQRTMLVIWGHSACRKIERLRVPVCTVWPFRSSFLEFAKVAPVRLTQIRASDVLTPCQYKNDAMGPSMPAVSQELGHLPFCQWRWLTSWRPENILRLISLPLPALTRLLV